MVVVGVFLYRNTDQPTTNFDRPTTIQTPFAAKAQPDDREGQGRLLTSSAAAKLTPLGGVCIMGSHRSPRTCMVVQRGALSETDIPPRALRYATTTEVVGRVSSAPGWPEKENDHARGECQYPAWSSWMAHVVWLGSICTCSQPYTTKRMGDVAFIGLTLFYMHRRMKKPFAGYWKRRAAPSERPEVTDNIVG